MRPWCLALAITFAACKAPPPPPAEPPSAPPAAPAAPRVTPPETGLTAEDNDLALVEAALDALACPWDAGFRLECHGYARWLDALGGGAPDPTLVRFIEDADPHVRYLGAVGLVRRGSAYRADPDLSGRVLAAAERETVPALAAPLGAAAARVDGSLPGVAARLTALARDHALAELRAALMGDLLTYGGPAFFDATRERLVRDPAEPVRLAALMAFWTGGVARAADVCALWADHLSDPAPRVADKAAYALATWGKCQARYPALLAALERRLAAGGFRFADANTLHAILGDPAVSPPDRTGAVSLARAAATTASAPWDARNRALELVAFHDPAASVVIGALAADPIPAVRDKARALLATIGPQ